MIPLPPMSPPAPLARHRRRPGRKEVLVQDTHHCMPFTTTLGVTPPSPLLTQPYEPSTIQPPFPAHSLLPLGCFPSPLLLCIHAHPPPPPLLYQSVLSFPSFLLPPDALPSLSVSFSTLCPLFLLLSILHLLFLPLFLLFFSSSLPSSLEASRSPKHPINPSHTYPAPITPLLLQGLAPIESLCKCIFGGYLSTSKLEARRITCPFIWHPSLSPSSSFIAIATGASYYMLRIAVISLVFIVRTMLANNISPSCGIRPLNCLAQLLYIEDHSLFFSTHHKPPQTTEFHHGTIDESRLRCPGSVVVAAQGEGPPEDRLNIVPWRTEHQRSWYVHFPV